MASSECQSHSSLNSALSNSESLDPGQVIWQKKSELQEITEEEQTYQSLLEGNTPALITGSLFKGYHKCNGIIGVPVTFLAEHCSEQFDIIGSGNGKRGQEIGIGPIPKDIKKQMVGHSAAGDLYIIINGKPKVPYNRILIRRLPGV